MKYFLILLVVVSLGCSAQQLTVRDISVSCDAGKNKRVFNNPIDADNYAKTLPCTGRTWVAASYYYVKGITPPTTGLVWGAPVTYENGAPLPLDQIAFYEVRYSRIYTVPAASTTMTFAAPELLLGGDVYLRAKAKNGLYSKEVGAAK